jgi:hypothetical protein
MGNNPKLVFNFASDPAPDLQQAFALAALAAGSIHAL